MPKSLRGCRSRSIRPAPVLGNYTYDFRTKLVYAAPRVAAYYDLPPEGAERGRPAADYLMAVPLAEHTLLNQAALDALAGAAFDATYHVTSKHYGTRLVHAHGSCYLDEHGRPAMLCGYLMDAMRLDVPMPSRLAALLVQAQAQADAMEMDVASYLIAATLNEIESSEP